MNKIILRNGYDSLKGIEAVEIWNLENTMPIHLLIGMKTENKFHTVKCKKYKANAETFEITDKKEINKILKLSQ